MEVVRTNLLDCLGVSQMDRLLHLKVEVFIHKEKVNLPTVSAEKQRNCHKSITENWRKSGFGSRRKRTETGDRESGFISDIRRSHL